MASQIESRVEYIIPTEHILALLLRSNMRGKFSLASSAGFQ